MANHVSILALRPHEQHEKGIVLGVFHNSFRLTTYPKMGIIASFYT